MVGTVPPSLQPKTASSSSSSSAAAVAAITTTTVAATSAAGGGGVVSAEEEAFRRNTDCVYFLASPLTCKKGSECEYRHSDIARVNPRDCWYWLHGSCLNPKCAFRHPPLDGLLGTQIPNPMGVSVPASQPTATPAAPASYASGKRVPCVFFQKGNCLKGDWCAFSHTPNSANNEVMQSQAAIPAAEPSMLKKTFGGLEKCTQEKKLSQTSVRKSTESTPLGKPMAKLESAPAKQETKMNKTLPPSGIDNVLHGYRPIDIRSANNGNRVNWPSRVQQPLHVNHHTSTVNGKDPEEVSREPSPGFDVLVDNEHGDSEFYHSEDQFGGTNDHEGMNEHYDNQSGDYNSMVDADRDVYRDSRGYDSFERFQGHQAQYAWEQRRSSSERMSGGLAHPERRQYGRADSPDQVDDSDLRRRLSKHKRVDGLRSVINHDYARERTDERGQLGTRKDMPRDHERHETSLSSRLRGRIKIPGTSSSATDGSDMRLNRDTERGRDRSGMSPGISQVSSRLRDRIKGRVQEDINHDGRHNGGPYMRRDIISYDNFDFAAPKSLAELKCHKNADRIDRHVNDEQSTGKRKYSKIEYQQQTGDDLSFEGPKPLEEILKRKRGSETKVFGGGMSARYAEDKNQSNRDERSRMGKVMGTPVDSNIINQNETEYKLASGVKIGSEGDQSVDLRSVSHNVTEVEEGMIVDDGAVDQEPEAYDHADEDSAYEQGDGDNYNLDEGEHGDAEEEFLDDDDDDDDDADDFAKKLGVTY